MKPMVIERPGEALKHDGLRLDDAYDALTDLCDGRLTGAAVLVP